MSVYRPTYKDAKTGETKQQRIWWYDFVFAGRRIQESSKSTRKTVAKEAEKNRRAELERTFNGIEDSRVERIRPVAEIAAEFLDDYKIRNPKSAVYAEYALRHVSRLLGDLLLAEVSPAAVRAYQTTRLTEGASPKSVNEEVGLLLRILGERGDLLRAKLKRERALKLKVTGNVARAFSDNEKTALIEQARKRRSPCIYPALMLAQHAGMRDAEIRGLQWGRVDLYKAILTVGSSKTEAGEGRTIPLNADVLSALVQHSRWYVAKFGETRAEWYVFPFGKPLPTDPTRPTTTFKTVWKSIRAEAGVQGRWHDNRHTFITDLAESGEASEQTIQELAGHVSKQMLKHYSHIRMEAKRRAVDVLSRPRKAQSSN